jgi:hypothetical protein
MLFERFTSRFFLKNHPQVIVLTPLTHLAQLFRFTKNFLDRWFWTAGFACQVLQSFHAFEFILV